MVAKSAPRAALRRICLPVALSLLAGLGCHKENGGVPLYVWDNTSASVEMWKDVNNVYNPSLPGATDTTVPDADQTITSTSIIGGPGSITLGWGGMAMDITNNTLYLVNQNTGAVYVIYNANTQNGNLSSTTDITSFTLGSSTSGGSVPARISTTSVFGQASLDPATNTLYVMETDPNSGNCQLWYVSPANNQVNGGTSGQVMGVSNDLWGCGVAGQGGYVFALYGNGSAIYDPTNLNQAYTAPRLRRGQNKAFPLNAADNTIGVALLTGPATDFYTPTPLIWSSLALDTLNNALYVAPELAANPTTAPAVLKFDQSLFNGGINQAPTATLADTQADLPDLRLISHPQNSDWLLGADFTPDTATAGGGLLLTGTGKAVLHVWKNPSKGGSSTEVTLPGVTEIRGALIGN